MTLDLRILALALVVACKGAEEARAKPAAGTAASDPAGAATPSADKGTPAGAGQTDPMVARADSARIRGNANAKVWMIIASDFQCPYCKMWHDSVDLTIRREYIDNGKVRLAFVNFPLNIHKNAVPAAEYAMCAAAQNKFWEVHDALFAAQERWAPLPDPSKVFDEAAGPVGVDMAALHSCVTSHKMLPLIQADHERAAKAGVNATPSFFIGNEMLEGVQPAEELRKALDAALAAK